jgi:hypothetical protein
MKHTITTIFFLFFGLTVCTAQTADKLKNNALSFELGKTGLIYNLNVDHKFPEKNFGVRVNIGSNLGKYLNFFTAGAGGYFLKSVKNNFLELGIDINYVTVVENSDDQRGIILLFPNYAINTCYAATNIGYRRYAKNTLFRIGFSPGIIKNKFLPGGYISYGLTF